MTDRASDLYYVTNDAPDWERADYAEMLMQYGSKHRRLRCSAVSCTGCSSNKSVYHVCPVCGSAEPEDNAGEGMICSCGAWMLVCRPSRIGDQPSIASYIIPSQLYKDTMARDDSI